MLTPQSSESRTCISLDGLWKFQTDPHAEGRSRGWHAEPLPNPADLPVPSSFNDLTQDPSLRDYYGDTWYQHTTFLPAFAEDQHVELHFAGAAHNAEVFFNGQQVGEHRGGFLPFAVDVTSHVRWGQENLVAVKLDNRISWQTLPPGEEDNGRPVYHYDFFHYAGLHRSVTLQLLPPQRITAIAVQAALSPKGQGLLACRIDTSISAGSIETDLLDPSGKSILRLDGASPHSEIPGTMPWSPATPNLYTLQVTLIDPQGRVLDRYRLRTGFRRIEVSGNQLLLNGQPIYLRGFGRHEDLPVKGRAHDAAWMVKDFNLMKWIGANSFRTSHYPYDEAVMDFADRNGFLVIDEVPAVGMNLWDGSAVFTGQRVNEASRRNHLQTMEDLVARDSHHPSVIMWSVGNEATTHEAASRDYFKPIIERVRELDPTRLVTLVENTNPSECKTADLVDITCINSYCSWYNDPGRLDLIEPQLEELLTAWHRASGKPVMITEYGADTIAGMHADPPTMFSEEYQEAFLQAYHRVLDRLDFTVGEHIWNFADFATKQGITRVGGNKKGLFTRDRKPKSAAHAVRRRWTK